MGLPMQTYRIGIKSLTGASRRQLEHWVSNPAQSDLDYTFENQMTPYFLALLKVGSVVVTNLNTKTSVNIESKILARLLLSQKRAGNLANR